MTFSFNMHRIGQTIARLRREHNMTQMQLADEMGVCFQVELLEWCVSLSGIKRTL